MAAREICDGGLGQNSGVSEAPFFGSRIAILVDRECVWERPVKPWRCCWRYFSWADERRCLCPGASDFRFWWRRTKKAIVLVTTATPPRAPRTPATICETIRLRLCTQTKLGTYRHAGGTCSGWSGGLSRMSRVRRMTYGRNSGHLLCLALVSALRVGCTVSWCIRLGLYGRHRACKRRILRGRRL